MPAVQAVGITTDRVPPFQLPVLDNRGDVAARLAAIDSMIIDDADGGSIAGDTPLAPVSAARANADALANRPPRISEPGPRIRADASADAHRAAARVRPVGSSAVGSSDLAVPPTAANEAAGDGARVRAAASVPAHARMRRPDGVPAAAPVSYAADDWRGRIKGAPARADAQIYGAPGGSRSQGPRASLAAGLSVPNTRAGDATTPAAANSERGAAAPAGHGRAAERTRAADAAKPVSMLDRAARIGLLGGLLAIFVLLFIFGPKISQWWGKL
jgi:hypothetical protein